MRWLDITHSDFCVRRKGWGYSLVEVMIGMTILTIVMAGSIVAIPQCRALAFKSDSTADAYEVLNLTLESLRTNTFEQMVDLVDSSDSSSMDETFEGLGIALTESESSYPWWYYRHQGTTSTTSYGSGVAVSEITMDGIDFEVKRTLSYYNTEKTVIEATVELSWEQQTQNFSITGKTLFAENGLSDKKFDIAN